jgi:ribosome-associated protein
MQIPDLEPELSYRTARSGGKGGQNVNKVETMVEVMWNVPATALFSHDDKQRIMYKLATRITKDGTLAVRSSEARSQLENKTEARRKLTELVVKALIRPKPRKATKPSKGAVQRRLDSKKRDSDRKASRRKDW